MASYVQLGEVRTWYDTHGGGPPLVPLHPVGRDARAWAPNLDPLAARFHIYTPERRGHDRTPDAKGPITYELMEQDTIAFLEQVVGGAAHLVGHSARDAAGGVAPTGARSPSAASMTDPRVPRGRPEPDARARPPGEANLNRPSSTRAEGCAAPTRFAARHEYLGYPLPSPATRAFRDDAPRPHVAVRVYRRAGQRYGMLHA